MKETVEEFTDKKLGEPVRQIAKGKIDIFANQHLQEYLKKYLPDLCTSLAIALTKGVNAMEMHYNDVEQSLHKLNLELAKSSNTANHTSDTMQNDISSLLNFREAMEAEMVSLREENVNLWAIIKARFDDVKKGKGGKKIEKLVAQPSRLAI